MFASRRVLDGEARLIERNSRRVIEGQSNEYDGTRGRRRRSQ